jgi:hypothetical protein
MTERKPADRRLEVSLKPTFQEILIMVDIMVEKTIALTIDAARPRDHSGSWHADFKAI